MSENKTPTYDASRAEVITSVDNTIQKIREQTEKKGLNYSSDQEWRIKEALAKHEANAEQDKNKRVRGL